MKVVQKHREDPINKAILRSFRSLGKNPWHMFAPHQTSESQPQECWTNLRRRIECHNFSIDH